MNWKEIFKVAGLMTVFVAVLELIWTYLLGGDIGNYVLLMGLLGTALILHRKLKKNEHWGIAWGMAIQTGMVFVLIFLLDLIGL